MAREPSAAAVRVAVGSDERTHLTDFIIEHLARAGFEVLLFGPLAGTQAPWTGVAEQVALEVQQGKAAWGVLSCWSGTGVSIAANKFAGVRAALCTDAETARAARRYNDANVLCLSLRLVSEAVAGEMLGAWFSAEVDETERENIERLKALDKPGEPA